DHVNNTNNPYWDEELTFSFEKVGKDFFQSTIELNVMDHYIGGITKSIGQCAMDTGTVYGANDRHFLCNKWFVLHQDVTAGNVMGFLKASVAVLDMRKDNIPDEEDDDDEMDEESLLASLIAGPGCKFEEVHLIAEILKAEGLPAMDSGPIDDKADPYV